MWKIEKEENQKESDKEKEVGKICIENKRKISTSDQEGNSKKFKNKSSDKNKETRKLK